MPQRFHDVRFRFTGCSRRYVTYVVERPSEWGLASYHVLQYQRRDKQLEIQPGVPAKGTLDPELLCWWEENRCILVTNNRKSMPLHLKDHLAQGHHIPGIITLNEDMSVGDNMEELLLIAGASFDNAYQDRVVYLPLSYRKV